MDTSTINQEFTVISDFIEFYKWLFDVSDFFGKLFQLNFSAFSLDLRFVF